MDDKELFLTLSTILSSLALLITAIGTTIKNYKDSRNTELETKMNLRKVEIEADTPTIEASKLIMETARDLREEIRCQDDKIAKLVMQIEEKDATIGELKLAIETKDKQITSLTTRVGELEKRLSNDESKFDRKEE